MELSKALLGLLMLAFFLFTSATGWSTMPTTMSRNRKNLSGRERRLFDSLEDELVKNGFSKDYVDFWICVSKLETGNFKSNLYVNHNNPWGMRQPSFRPTTSSVPTGSGFASYPSVELAAKDLAYYMLALNYPTISPNDLRGHVALMKRKKYFIENEEYYYNAVKNLCS